MKIQRIGLSLTAVAVAITATYLVRAQTEVNLIGRWPFAEGTGTNTMDISGHQYPGALTGTPLPVWTAGISSNALGFDGIQNAVIVADDPALTPTNALTLAAWVKTQPFATGEIIAKWNTNGVGGSYLLSLTNGCVVLELSLSGQYTALIGATACLSDTNWHQVAGSYDGNTMTVALDGIIAGTQVATGAIDLVTAPLEFGLLPASLADVRMYDRALATNELALLAIAGSAGTSVSDATAANAGTSSNNPITWNGSVGTTTNWSVPGATRGGGLTSVVMGMAIVDLAAQIQFTSVPPMSVALSSLAPLQVPYAPIEGIASCVNCIMTPNSKLMQLVQRFKTFSWNMVAPVDLQTFNSDLFVPSFSARNGNPAWDTRTFPGVNHWNLPDNSYLNSDFFDRLFGQGEENYVHP